MSGLEAMIHEMEKMLGLGESPAGSNRNYVTSWYGLVGPWCDMAITYAAWHSGNQDAVTFGGKYAYTVAHAQAFADHGRWHTDVAGIRGGDIVFFDWDGSNSIGAIDHVGIVTGVNGRDVYTIEANSDNVCARRVRGATTIVGYGRPAYAPVSTPPPPKPTPSPGGGSYRPPAFPAGLRPDASRPSAKGLQRALKAAGHLSKGVTLDDNYGPLTQAAVTRFHDRHPQYANRPGDPAIGPLGWAKLFSEAYGR